MSGVRSDTTERELPVEEHRALKPDDSQHFGKHIHVHSLVHGS
jgi:hypothetical protein